MIMLKLLDIAPLPRVFTHTPPPPPKEEVVDSVCSCGCCCKDSVADSLSSVHVLTNGNVTDDTGLLWIALTALAIIVVLFVCFRIAKAYRKQLSVN